MRKMMDEALDQKLGHASLAVSPKMMTVRAFERISKDDLVQDEEPLAEGAFGSVFGGTYCGMNVAIKKAKLDMLPLRGPGVPVCTQETWGCSSFVYTRSRWSGRTQTVVALR